MVGVYVLTEDTYGEDFFKILIQQLKQEGIIDRQLPIKVKAMPKRCSPKLDRMLKLIELKGFSKIIFVVDGDGNDENRVKQIEKEHGRALKKSQLIVIVNKYEIEEWLLYAYGQKIPAHPKPSIEIRRIFSDYEKNQLPKILKKTISDSKKWDRLKNYKKFQELLSAINSNS